MANGQWLYLGVVFAVVVSKKVITLQKEKRCLYAGR